MWIWAFILALINIGLLFGLILNIPVVFYKFNVLISLCIALGILFRIKYKIDEGLLEKLEDEASELKETLTKLETEYKVHTDEASEAIEDDDQKGTEKG